MAIGELWMYPNHAESFPQGDPQGQGPWISPEYGRIVDGQYTYASLTAGTTPFSQVLYPYGYYDIQNLEEGVTLQGLAVYIAAKEDSDDSSFDTVQLRQNTGFVGVNRASGQRFGTNWTPWVIFGGPYDDWNLGANFNYYYLATEAFGVGIVAETDPGVGSTPKIMAVLMKLWYEIPESGFVLMPAPPGWHKWLNGSGGGNGGNGDNGNGDDPSPPDQPHLGETVMVDTSPDYQESLLRRVLGNLQDEHHLGFDKLYDGNDYDDTPGTCNDAALTAATAKQSVIGDPRTILTLEELIDAGRCFVAPGPSKYLYCTFLGIGADDDVIDFNIWGWRHWHNKAGVFCDLWTPQLLVTGDAVLSAFLGPAAPRRDGSGHYCVMPFDNHWRMTDHFANIVDTQLADPADEAWHDTEPAAANDTPVWGGFALGGIHLIEFELSTPGQGGPEQMNVAWYLI